MSEKGKSYVENTKTGLLQNTLVKEDDELVRSDKTLLDGIPRGAITGIYGTRASGKTILTTQLAFDTMEALGGNVLSIDTEGSHHTYLSYVDRFSDRYDMDVGITESTYREGLDEVKTVKEADADHEFCVMSCRDVEGLLSLVGCPLTLEVSKNKIDVAPGEEWNTKFWDSPLGEYIIDNDIKYIVIDSISNPMKKFPTSQQNYPSRATTGYNILLGLQEAAKSSWDKPVGKIPVLSVIHQSNNPTRPWEDPNFVGGGAVGYNTKTMLYISKERTQRTSKTKDRPDNVAEVWLDRSVDRGPWTETGYVEIELTDEGFKPYLRDEEDEEDDE